MRAKGAQRIKRLMLPRRLLSTNSVYETSFSNRAGSDLGRRLPRCFEAGRPPAGGTSIYAAGRPRMNLPMQYRRRKARLAMLAAASCGHQSESTAICVAADPQLIVLSPHSLLAGLRVPSTADAGRG